MMYYNYIKIINFICLALLLIDFSNSKENRVSQVDLPSYFPVCYRNDPNLSKCILEASDQLRPHLKVGIPELKIVPLEPLLIPQVAFKQGSKSFNIAVNLTDTLVYGLSEYKFSKLEFHPKNYRFVADATIGNLKVSGKYNVTGQILSSAVNSKGNYKATIESGHFQTVFSCKSKVINGQEHIAPSNINTTIDVFKPAGRLSGLFEDNPVLKEITENILRDNVDDVFEDLKPAIVKVINQILQDSLLRRITESVPYDKLFPATA